MNAPEQLMTQEELAFRWKVSEATLERDRSLKKGCRYLKLGGLIRYRLQDVLEYEDACVHEPAKKTAREKAAAQRQSLIPAPLAEQQFERYYRQGYDAGLAAQRQPLTDEQIRDLWSWSETAEAERTATTQQHAFARAIEQAHGITGEKK